MFCDITSDLPSSTALARFRCSPLHRASGGSAVQSGLGCFALGRLRHIEVVIGRRSRTVGHDGGMVKEGGRWALLAKLFSSLFLSGPVAVE